MIGFFTAGWGRWAALALAFTLWTGAVYHKGASSAREECKAEQIQKTLDETLRQLTEAQKAVKEADVQADKSASEILALEIARGRLNVEAKLNSTPCVFTESIIDQLRDIK